MTQEQTYVKINEVAQAIGKNFQPEKIIFFGSYVWGKPGPDSDVDLFIIKETKNTRETARQISRSVSPRPFPIDFIVYTPSQTEKRKKIGDFFVKNILEKGQIIYVGQ